MKIVREALAGIKIGVLARIYDVHPESIRQWVRDHRDSIPLEEIPMTLGEKELEIEILRELLKKKDPNAKVALLLLLEKRYCYQCRLINLRLLVADLNTIWLLGSQSRTIVRN
ncbi:transposase [Paenibacillus etheri]|uniref:transposase n=1 Tax=Paenibacillus etheri TaxID=1306852 RepID=UPI0014288A47